MLTVSQISKSYDTEVILHKVSFTLNAGERVGLIGPNGSGKTTLLRILAGELKPDAGGFRLNPPGLRIGYLPQGLEPDPKDSIATFLAGFQPDLEALTAELEPLAAALARSPQQPALQLRYDRILSQIEAAAENAGRTPAVLAALGLAEMPLDTPARYLSGGQKTRLAMAAVLLSDPQLLLLDEPTNHLDLRMLEWLEEWLASFPGGVLLVSHDRTFLDHSVNGILEIDPHTHGLRRFPGNYSDYLEARLAEKERQWQTYNQQQAEIARLQHAVARVQSDAAFKKGGKGDSGDKFAKGFFANRTKGTIARAKHLEARLDKLLTDDKVEKPQAGWQMKLEFTDTPSSGRDVIQFEDLSIGYGGQVLLADLNGYVAHGSRVALVGPNGSGKTTLLRTIVGRIPPLAGTVRLGAGVKVGYMAQEQEDLDPEMDSLSLIRSLAPISETEARAFLHKFLFSGDDVFVPIGRLSYGERARLSLARFVTLGCNLLLLDEPINHLDIPSRSRFEDSLRNFEGTILTVVHDRYFIEGFATQIWEISEAELRTYLP